MKTFACSLVCRNGIIGGSLHIEDKSIIYKTNKLTVDKQYKRLLLPLDEIETLTWKWVVFPIATFQMKSGKKHKIIIFSKRRFEKCFREA